MALGRKKKTQEVDNNEQEIELVKQEDNRNILVKNKKTLKDLIAPSGIDASNINHLAIISSITRLVFSISASNFSRIFGEKVIPDVSRHV